MKSTTRGTLAAVVTGVAAAVGAAATPAAAVGTVPIPVPLGGLSTLGMEAPKVGLEMPVPLLMPGVPEGPRYVTGHLLPERTLPPVPLTGALPGVSLSAPLPQVLGDGFDHVAVSTPTNDLRTLTPGLSLDAPLTPPNPGNFGLPSLKQPEAGVIAPALQTVADANLTGQ